MDTSTIAVTAFALALCAWTPGGEEPAAQLSEARMIVEYDPAQGEASLIVEAESEETFDRVDIRNSQGASFLRIQTGGGQPMVLSGFGLETPSTSLATLFDTYAEGPYMFRARSAGGSRFGGVVHLSHDLPAQPIVLYPLDGASEVPTTNLIVSWTPDLAVAEYRVGIEQGENDGLTITLPAGSSSFQVPNNFLVSGAEIHLEIGATGRNGNRTLGKVTFTTR